jgi:putative hydrolase of the HAD superfamily
MSKQPNSIEAIVFDWGDTLMRVFPQFKGPMTTWPEVAVVKGANDTLATLKKDYRIFVATNAAESNTEQVRQAFARVGIDQEIERIFTTNELCGECKPSPSFFYAIEDALHISADQMVMVGDSIKSDILGAVQAGWKTIWYNPDALPSNGLIPLHDAEVLNLSDISLALQGLTLPSYSTCLAWLSEQGISHNLLIHLQIVSAVAYQMAQWLRAHEVIVNPILVQRGALLHDMMKIGSRQNPKERRDHGTLASEVLLERGQAALAEIARRHLLFCILDEKSEPLTWEQKLVYFADKLVEKGQIEPLDVRLQGLRLRYPQDSARIQASAPAIYALQGELCETLQFTPNALIQHLKAALYGV